MIELDEAKDNTFSLNDAMTPMIDVIFVLIAFMMLMINMPLLTMEVELPATAEKITLSQSSKQTLTITLKNNVDYWLVDGQQIANLALLENALMAAKKRYGANLSVQIVSDKKVAMEQIVQLFALMQRLELSVSHLALKQA